MLSFFKRRNKKQEVRFEPLPVQVGVGNVDQLRRHVGRLVNLYSAAARDPGREDVAAEIRLRKAYVVAYGHEAPDSLADAQKLFERLARG